MISSIDSVGATMLTKVGSIVAKSTFLMSAFYEAKVTPEILQCGV